MFGQDYSYCAAGLVFSQAVTPLGLALPIYSATAIGGAGICALPLWNPPSSPVNCELLAIDLDYGSGTADFGAIGIMALPLNEVASGAVCSALATTDPSNGLVLQGVRSKVKSSNSAGASTVVAGTVAVPTVNSTAPGWYRSIADFNLEAATGTAHATGIHTYEFKGRVIVPPGVMIYFACTKASVALYAGTLIWKEITR